LLLFLADALLLYLLRDALLLQLSFLQRPMMLELLFPLFLQLDLPLPLLLVLHLSLPLLRGVLLLAVLRFLLLRLQIPFLLEL